MERRDTVGMQRKFKPAFIELNKLESKILKIKGFILTWHVHSIEELLQSTHHQKVYAITAQIGTDVSNWNDAGNLTKEEREVYFAEREALEDKLSLLNQEIEEREPTWWESVKDIFIDFNSMIVSNLPMVTASRMPVVMKIFLLPFKKMAELIKPSPKEKEKEKEKE
ncbi:MAG: hypothetical protein DRG24_01565 [Epsilonproteobacteria bacterium]|nr:MAG: hypothetical protein DRG24_01565 [Campylobacterota bacterium]